MVNSISLNSPSVDDDSDLGFEVGSAWRDITAGRFYVCTDATPGAAVWQQSQPDLPSATVAGDEMTLVYDRMVRGSLGEMLLLLMEIRDLLRGGSEDVATD
jgi:hypothetical protein